MPESNELLKMKNKSKKNKTVERASKAALNRQQHSEDLESAARQKFSGERFSFCQGNVLMGVWFGMSDCPELVVCRERRA